MRKHPRVVYVRVCPFIDIGDFLSFGVVSHSRRVKSGSMFTQSDNENTATQNHKIMFHSNVSFRVDSDFMNECFSQLEYRYVPVIVEDIRFNFSPILSENIQWRLRVKKLF